MIGGLFMTIEECQDDMQVSLNLLRRTTKEQLNNVGMRLMNNSFLPPDANDAIKELIKCRRLENAAKLIERVLDNKD